MSDIGGNLEKMAEGIEALPQRLAEIFAMHRAGTATGLPPAAPVGNLPKALPVPQAKEAILPEVFKAAMGEMVKPIVQPFQDIGKGLKEAIQAAVKPAADELKAALAAYLPKAQAVAPASLPHAQPLPQALPLAQPVGAPASKSAPPLPQAIPALPQARPSFVGTNLPTPTVAPPALPTALPQAQPVAAVEPGGLPAASTPSLPNAPGGGGAAASGGAEMGEVVDLLRELIDAVKEQGKAGGPKSIQPAEGHRPFGSVVFRQGQSDDAGPTTVSVHGRGV